MRTTFAVMALFASASAVSPIDPEYYASIATEININNSILHRHHHQKPAKGKDAYDGDSNTVSMYDDMQQFPNERAAKAAHADNKSKYGAQRIHGDTRAQTGHRHHHHHRHHKADAYDHDPTTTSDYDDAKNINKGMNPYSRVFGDADDTPGLKVIEQRIKDKMAAMKAAPKEYPEIPAQTQAARDAISGAIHRKIGKASQEDYVRNGATPQ